MYVSLSRGVLMVRVYVTCEDSGGELLQVTHNPQFDELN
jgi:hypothetical protein